MKTELNRPLDKPYFLLRTHDGISHFFDPQVERLFSSDKDGLFRFMPKARIVERNGVKSVSFQLTKPQAKTLRPLKAITHPELKALKVAALNFYKPKREITKFESSLRKAFQLPDPELEPDAYYLWGSRKKPKLLVLWGVEKVPGSSLPIVNFPSSKSGSLGDSVTEKLKIKVIRRTKEWVLTTSALCMVALGALAFALAKDKAPPEVSQVSSVNDPRAISVIFDEAVDPSSLGVETFKIRNTAHILIPRLDPDNPKRVILGLNENLRDGEDYFLDFGLQEKPSDLAGNFLGEKQILDSERLRQFRFEDQRPPRVLEVEPLPPHSLIVRLNEAISRRSAMRPSTFRLSDFRLTNTELSEDSLEVTLEFEETLVHNGSYLLEINGLEDDSEYRNQLHDKIEFRYLDTFAPDLISCSEGAGQAEVILRFDECLDPNTALNPKNYKIGENVLIKNVSSYMAYHDPKWGKESFTAVRLLTEPLVRSKEYTIEVNSIGDRMTPSNQMDKQEGKFSFHGALDRSPPFVRKIRGSANSLLIEFSEILDPDKISADDFHLRDLQRNKEIKIGSFNRGIRSGVTFVNASLETTQYPGRLFHLLVKNCTDASGNKAHLEKTYNARGLFREPISIMPSTPLSAGQSEIQFRLPLGVKWDAKGIEKVEAYGISTTGGGGVEVEKLEYESSSGMGQVKLNLKTPIGNGNYQFYIEGAKLSDGTIVDRAYRGLVAIGS